MRILVLALCALLMAAPAGAVIRVVTTDGSPAVPNLPGYLASETAAGTNISTVLAASAASDTVYVHSGTYDVQIPYTSWNADNITLIGAQDKTSEIRWTGGADGNYMVSAGDRAAGFTGATLKWLRFDGDGFSGLGMLVAGAEDATITDCVWEGTWRANIVHGVGFLASGHNATNVTVEACSLSSNYQGVNPSIPVILGTGATLEGATGVTFTGCIFDYSDMYSTTESIQLTGVTDFLMEDFTLMLADHRSAASSYGISVRSEAPAEMADGIIIRDGTIIAQEVAANDLVAISIGRNPATSSGIVDNVTLERLIVDVPAVDLHFGIKVEADYYSGSTAGLDDSHSDNINIFDCVVTGGRTGIGFHENVRFATMARNRIIGPGNTAAAGYQTFGIVVEDARHVNVVDNWVSNCEKALTMSHSGTTPLAWKNYNVRIIGNVFQNSTKGINLQYDEGGDSVTDSLMISQGNLFWNCTSPAYKDVAATDTDFTLTTWKAYTVPGLVGFEHAAGDTEDPTWPRITGALPGGSMRRGPGRPGVN